MSDDICDGPNGCGAVVGDWDMHKAWHERMAEVAQQANSADMYTRPIGPGIQFELQSQDEIDRQAQERADKLFQPNCFHGGVKHVYSKQTCPDSGPVT